MGHSPTPELQTWYSALFNRFERTGYHAVKSDKVNAPIIEEFPVVMECELLEFVDTLMFNQFQNDYYSTGEKVATAWNAGKDLMKK